MQAVKKAVKSVVEKEHKRILVITLAHDDQLVVKGDNMSYLNLEEDVNLTTALKRILTDRREEEETSYNFGHNFAYKESQNIEFPKMFAKIGGKNWKGGNVAKTLSKYFSMLDFGLNAQHTYGKAEDKPVWWPKRPKWKEFKNPSKASKDETTTIIRHLLQHHGINPNKHYLYYPEEEEDDNDSSSSDEEEQDSDTNQNESDLNNSFDEDNITSSSLSGVVNRVSKTCLKGNIHTKMAGKN